jgi:hypothetical protein
MKFEYSVGNLKIGKDTLIFNMGSASNCPSGKAGQCDLFNSNSCYALKSEKRYPEVLPYRTRQEEYWLGSDALTIVEDIQKVLSTNSRRKVALKYVRVNEAGDLHSEKCLDKLKDIARALPEIVFYTYTHRQDIIGEGVDLPDNLVLNTSNFEAKGCNSFSIDLTVKVRSLKKEWKIAREKIRENKGENSLSCIGDCSKCTLCKVSHGKVIWVPLH